MRTLLEGLSAFQRRPVALAPIALEGIVVGLLVMIGVLPAVGANAPAGAVFPLDVYHDVKQVLALSSSWPRALSLLLIAFIVRGAVLAAVLVLADGKERLFLRTFVSCLRLVALTGVGLSPVAVLFFSGTAIRYAPFLWIAAPAGAAISLLALRRAVALSPEGRDPEVRGVPEIGSFLTYAYFVAGSAAALSFLGDRNRFLAGLLLASLGPVHALFLLGWRESAGRETQRSAGTIAVVVSVVLFGGIALGTFYDRVVRSPGPVSTADSPGSLLLLGGVDSTSRTGALTELDPRDLGFQRGRTMLLSYTSSTEYSELDTHGDLEAVAQEVGSQIEGADRPTSLVGHSQAALILDRLLDAEPAEPDASVMLAAPPPYPPSLDIPAPDIVAAGKTGGDSARVLSWLLRRAGRTGFDVDAPASPTNLEPVVVVRSETRRAAVWPLADSVWLDRDWRRPGETNLVALTDHVGVTNNGGVLSAAQTFLAGRTIVSEEATWKSVLVPIVRYTFEPFRPTGPDDR